MVQIHVADFVLERRTHHEILGYWGEHTTFQRWSKKIYVDGRDDDRQRFVYEVGQFYRRNPELSYVRAGLDGRVVVLGVFHGREWCELYTSTLCPGISVPQEEILAAFERRLAKGGKLIR